MMSLAVMSVGVTPSGAAPRSTPAAANFGNPVPLTIRGYGGDAMEPFVSPDGRYLFFNNRNDAGTNTNLYFARRVDDTTFAYGGAIRGANSAALDAVPSMDAANNLYFVSTRSYGRTLSTVYRGKFASGAVSAVAIVRGISKTIPGRVNFDADISADGSRLYFVDGRFTGGQPVSADLAIAQKTPTGFSRLANSAQLLANVNTAALEYAAAISNDGRSLYFTRAEVPLGSKPPAIFVATRSSTSNAFGAPVKLTTLTGFVEAPALSPSGRSLYFHRLVGNKFVIFRASKP